jgi:hypothetical protein
MLVPLPITAWPAQTLVPSGWHRLRRLPVSSVVSVVRSLIQAPPASGRSPLVDSLGCVRYEPTCVVGDDPGEIVRHAAPLDERARTQLREQQIARMRVDPAAVAARERRVAIGRAPAGRVLEARFA